MSLKHALESSDACLAIGRGVVSLLVTKNLESAKKAMFESARNREPAEWAVNDPQVQHALEEMAKMFEK